MGGDEAGVDDVLQGLLRGYHTVTRLPVQWGDQDAFGHVNNVVYFRWLESARIDLLAACPSGVGMTNAGLGPIVASLTCDYRRQLRFPDEVSVGSRVGKLGNTSVELEHVVVSRMQGQVVATARCVVVVFNYQLQRPTRIPDDLRRAFERSMAIAGGAVESGT
ncbi:MAG: acyl-CoA thioesterase [Planctomyces sp.]|jgi:acyl-CoA thioester hydrolase|nr:acyl-CoA thioesterase [Planctomyces sp.]